MDRQRPFDRVPDEEDQREDDRKDGGGYFKSYSKVVREFVGDQGPKDANQNDSNPIDGGDVPSRSELDSQGEDG